MKKIGVLCVALAMAIGGAMPAIAGPQEGEKAFLNELKQAVPADRMKSIDDLYAKWQDVQAGKSKAVIIDIRTEAEFDAGHILGSSNVDSGHAYTIPGASWAKEADTEIWVFCRTQHRASYFVSMLYKYGYKNIFLAEGGVKSWSEKGYPLVNKYLGEIKVVKYENKMKEDYIYRENK